jgi:hypothetical protein
MSFGKMCPFVFCFRCDSRIQRICRKQILGSEVVMRMERIDRFLRKVCSYGAGESGNISIMIFSLFQSLALGGTLLLWLLQLKLCVEVFPDYVTAKLFEHKCQRANYLSTPLSALISTKISKIEENFFILTELHLQVYVAIPYFA